MTYVLVDFQNAEDIAVSVGFGLDIGTGSLGIDNDFAPMLGDSAARSWTACVRAMIGGNCEV